MNRFRFTTLLVASIVLAASAQAQSAPPDGGHYYEGAPNNFIASPPRAGTFYYNDFNHYKASYYSYYNPDTSEGGNSVTNRNFGYNNGGNGGSKDYSGAAIIGQNRGTYTSGDNVGIKVNLERSSSGSGLSNKPFDPLDPQVGFSVSGDGFPPGSTGHMLATENNSINFYSPYPADPSVYARFSISTSGYENIQLSFDLGLNGSSSANYRFMASADGGATWSYTQDLFNGSAGWLTEPLLFDFSNNPEFANNTSFVFQMISIRGESGLWESVGGGQSNDDGSGVGAVGLLFDRVTLSGDAMPVPEPATFAAVLGLATAALAWHRRRRPV